MSTKTISIGVNCPAYRGALVPKFDKMRINESCFEDELRGKNWDACIENEVGRIEWLSEDGEDPSDRWEPEVKRAFKENGLKAGARIDVMFGSRDSGYVHEYDLYV